MNLDQLIYPESIAVVGASHDATRISGRPLPMLRGHGYPGRVYPVNPRHDRLQGYKCYARLADLPEVPDLVMVMIGAQHVPGILRESVELGVRWVIVYSSGFNESSGGRERAILLQEIVRGTSTHFLGPNTEGLMDFSAGIPLGFSPVIDPERGYRESLEPHSTVILSQSGGVGFSLYEWCRKFGLGVRTVVSTGNELDVEVTDFIAAYGLREGVENIVLFLEGLRDPQRFVNEVRRVRARGVGVFALRIGTLPAGRRSAPAHTGKPPASADLNAVLAKDGVVIESDLEILLARLKGLTDGPSRGGCRVGILSTSGGAGIWASDWVERFGLKVPELSQDLQQKLSQNLPSFAALANPVDVTAQASFAGGLDVSLQTLMDSDEIDGVLFIANFGFNQRLIKDPGFSRVLRERTKPVAVFSYSPPSKEASGFFRRLGVPLFSSPRQAAAAMSSLLQAAPRSRAF